MRSWLFLFVVLAVTPPSLAGFVELGLSGSYKHQNIGTGAWDRAQALSASAAYNFDEMSAIEVSYTDSIQRRYISSSTGNNHTTSVYARLVGADGILTIGDRETVIRPYVKLGVAYIIEKRIVDQYDPFPASEHQDSPALVPSGGLGVRVALTKTMSLRAGFDVWTSRPVDQTPTDYDYTGRVGLSWLF